MAQSYTPPPLGLHPYIYTQTHTNKITFLLSFSVFSNTFYPHEESERAIMLEIIVKRRTEALVKKFNNKHYTLANSQKTVLQAKCIAFLNNFRYHYNWPLLFMIIRIMPYYMCSFCLF